MWLGGYHLPMSSSGQIRSGKYWHQHAPSGATLELSGSSLTSLRKSLKSTRFCTSFRPGKLTQERRHITGSSERTPGSWYFSIRYWYYGPVKIFAIAWQIGHSRFWDTCIRVPSLSSTFMLPLSFLHLSVMIKRVSARQHSTQISSLSFRVSNSTMEE